MGRVGSGWAVSDMLSGQMDQTVRPAITVTLANIWLHNKLATYFLSQPAFLFQNNIWKNEGSMFEEGWLNSPLAKQQYTMVCL